MLDITNAPGGITITWDKADDPRSYIADAVRLGHLKDGLRALGDPMEFAEVAAADDQAKEQLRSVSWLIDVLERRQDALIVALRERRDADPVTGASWTDLVRLVDPEEENPLSKRSTMQARYEAGRRRASRP